MAYVTAIGSNPEQVEYRLEQRHGCGAAEVQFSYHVDGRERPLRWIGKGLETFGIVPGSELTEDQHEMARALMAGLDPRTGERLVAPKLGVYADAKVALAPLVAAVQAAAAARGVEAAELFAGGSNAGAWGRAERAVARLGEGAVLRADEAGRLADAAGVDVAAVWGREVYAAAVANLSETVTVTLEDGRSVSAVVPRRQVVGNMGYDLTFTLPKSHSLLLAFADEDTAASIEAVYTDGVNDTFTWLEAATAYGMRGKHGNGKTAEVIEGGGFAGWTMTHRAARPVDGRVVGDPHWHVHLTIANMTLGADGNWSTVAAGGRDLMRHAPAADHVLKALVRHRLAATFGVEFARSERTGAWEVAAIPDATLVAFSKRGASIAALLADLGFDAETATRRAEDLAAAQTRAGKAHATAAPDATLRERWQAEAREHGVDPDGLAAAALPGPPDGDAPAEAQTARELCEDELLAVVTARLLDPEHGLTSTGRRFSRADALAAVADALPGGAADIAAIEAITDKALRHAGIVALPARQDRAPERTPPSAELAAGQAPAVGSAANLNGARRQLGATHMANGTRYTTADVIAAEQVILATAATSVPGQRAARVEAEVAELAIAAVQAGQGYELSAEQAAAVTRLVTVGRAVDAVLGPPGTGKTTMLRAARAAFEAGGFTVAGAATAAVAAANLTAESGIQARTVAQWRHAIHAGDGLTGVDVLVLDEANLTDDRDRAVLYREAECTGTAIVEVGDPQQLRGVGCGSLFGRVHALVEGAALRENRRQRDADERAAIAAWREGRYGQALSSWSARDRLVATETAQEAVTATVTRWMTERDGAPDAHTEIAGVVMLAATNETVERLNDVAQAVRASLGELGAGRDYRLAAGREVRLHEGDHVLIRLNDRAQRRHEGPDVLNGYRGVIERIGDDGRVAVAWARDGDDGPAVTRAVLDPSFIAAGGLSLGYAMTVHKAEGLTVTADWTRPDGTRAGGAVLVHTAGMDEPALHVASTRHRERMWLFAAREALETAEDTWQRGTPTAAADLTARVIGALGAHAAATAAAPNDIPVHDDLGRDPTRSTHPDQAGRRLQREPVPVQPLQDRHPEATTEPAAPPVLEPTAEPAVDPAPAGAGEKVRQDATAAEGDTLARAAAAAADWTSEVAVLDEQPAAAAGSAEPGPAEAAGAPPTIGDPAPEPARDRARERAELAAVRAAAMARIQDAARRRQEQAEPARQTQDRAAEAERVQQERAAAARREREIREAEERRRDLDRGPGLSM